MCSSICSRRTESTDIESKPTPNVFSRCVVSLRIVNTNICYVMNMLMRIIIDRNARIAAPHGFQIQQQIVAPSKYTIKYLQCAKLSAKLRRMPLGTLQ